MEPLHAKQIEVNGNSSQNHSQDYLVSLFANLFSGPLSDSKPLRNIPKETEKRVVIYFKEGSGINIPLRWIEKLRNEPSLLKDLSFDEEIHLSKVEKDVFLAIINLFSPDYINRPEVETKQVLDAAKYLQLPLVSKHEQSRVTKKIESFKDESKLKEAFEIYKSISKYPFSWRDSIQAALANFWGTLFLNSNNREELIKIYNTQKIFFISLCDDGGVTAIQITEDFRDPSILKLWDDLSKLEYMKRLRITWGIYTDDIISCVPKQVLHLELCCCQRLTGDGLGLMPKSLVHLTLNACSLSEGALEHIPPGIILNYSLLS